MANFTFAGIFAGIGGFRIALEQVGLKCLYSCEINSSCRRVYFENFGEHPASDTAFLINPRKSSLFIDIYNILVATTSGTKFG